MADVRLTAINPEDSQVYPVACNDKGELLLDSGGASGDLDVTGNLTVAGSGTFGADVQIGDRAGNDPYFLLVPNSNDSGQNKIISRDGVSGTSGADLIIATGTGATSTSLTIKADGSAEFAGDVQIGGDAVSTPGCFLGSNGTVKAARDDANNIFIGRSTTSNSVTFSVLGNGSASFAGDINTTSSGVWDSGFANGRLNIWNAATTAGTTLITAKSNNGGTQVEKFSVLSNGSATFAGNVIAPNINFKLAPATVAAMPAPLIDEGFAANNEVDLLSVIIEMKLQIRNLNAFMQRSTQDDPET